MILLLLVFFRFSTICSATEAWNLRTMRAVLNLRPLLLNWCILKRLQGGRDCAIFFILFIFCVKCSALDHSATAAPPPPSLCIFDLLASPTEKVSLEFLLQIGNCAVIWKGLLWLGDNKPIYCMVWEINSPYAFHILTDPYKTELSKLVPINAGNAGNWTRVGWVRSSDATSVLCQPPKSGIVLSLNVLQLREN